MGGKKTWYIVDGYRPPAQPVPEPGYEGHECIMILNTNPVEANLRMSIYYMDKEPVEGIRLQAPAKRITAFRSSEKDRFGGVELQVNEQYSLVVESDIDVVVQYGRMDVQQNNLAYLGMMGFSE